MGLKEDFEALRTAESDLTAGAQDARAQLSERRCWFGTRIQSGETTGDLVLDYALVHWGGSLDHVSAKLREIQTSFAGKTGQLALLVIEVNEKYSECDSEPAGGGIMPPSHVSFNCWSELTLILGVLTADHLRLDVLNGKIELPTNGCSVVSDVEHECKVVYQETPYVLEREESLALYIPWPSKTISLIAGDKEVTEWFNQPRRLGPVAMSDLLLRMMISLGDKLDSIPGMSAKLKQIASDLEQEMDRVSKELAACHDLLMDVSRNLREDELLEVARKLRQHVQELKNLMARAQEFGLANRLNATALKAGNT